MFMDCIRATRTQGIKVFFLVRGVSRKLWARVRRRHWAHRQFETQCDEISLLSVGFVSMFVCVCLLCWRPEEAIKPPKRYITSSRERHCHRLKWNGRRRGMRQFLSVRYWFYVDWRAGVRMHAHRERRSLAQAQWAKMKTTWTTMATITSTRPNRHGDRRWEWKTLCVSGATSPASEIAIFYYV